MCVCVRQCMRICVCACVRVCVRVRACACVCVCAFSFVSMLVACILRGLLIIIHLPVNICPKQVSTGRQFLALHLRTAVLCLKWGAFMYVQHAEPRDAASERQRHHR